MFDSTKLVLPLNLIIDSITPNIDAIVIDKDRTTVLTVEPTSPYYNTLATISETNIVPTDKNTIREVLYDRIDIGNYIANRATLSKREDGSFEYILLSDEDNTTILNAGVAAISRVLNYHYELPIVSDDLTTIVPSPYFVKNSTFGDIYLLSNGVVMSDNLSYVRGNIVVYNLPDTLEYSYNKLKTQQSGMSFYREWDSSEIVEITLPPIDTADGWSLQIEDVSAIDNVGNGVRWVSMSFDNNSGDWVFTSVSGQIHRMSGATTSKIKISMTDQHVVINGNILVNNNSYVTQFEDISVPSVYKNGLNRVSIYSSNPDADTVNFKVNVKSNEASAKDSLKTNSTNYVKRRNIIGANIASNALTGVIKYPIKVTKYDTVGYRQNGITQTFTSDDTSGYISTIDTFTTDFKQSVVFNIENFNELIKNNKVDSFTTVVTSKNNVNFKYEVASKVVDTEDGIGLSVSSIINGETTFIANKSVGAGDMNLSVITSIGENKVIKDLSTISEYYIPTIGIPSGEISKQYVVKLIIKMKDNTKLPNIELTKELISLNQA